MKTVLVLVFVVMTSGQIRYKIPSNWYQPPNNGYRPPSNGYQPPRNGYHPPSNWYQSTSNGYHPPSNGYQPTSNGYHPPNNGYKPPSNGYQHPRNGYQPGSSSQTTSSNTETVLMIPPRHGFNSGFDDHSNFNSQPGSSSQTTSSNTETVIDNQFGGSEYHYSWRHDGSQKYTHTQAVSYCTLLLPGNWAPISIEGRDEDKLVSEVITGDRLTFIWTGGSKSGGSFRWPNGPISYSNWSHTGGAGAAQPDNREQGGEECLAILNNIYGDGIKWHDVACHHTKPVICERKTT